MTLKLIPHHPTINPITVRNSKNLAFGRAIFIVITGGLLLATGAGAQTSEVRTVARTESRPEPESDSVIEFQRAPGPMDHHRPGWHDPGHGHRHGQGQSFRHPIMGWMRGRLDTDRDGAISRAELEAEHLRHVALFDQADADHDGKVTANELHAVHARHRKDQRLEQRRETRPGPAPQSELPSRPSQGGEPAR